MKLIIPNTELKKLVKQMKSFLKKTDRYVKKPRSKRKGRGR